MSSMNRNSRSSGKKKFGKNLNKVTKAPAPPIAANARAGTSSSRNGLLLLSTKRSSSTGAAAASGGLLSSKTPSSPSKPMQPLGLTTESYSSAHDALLGAVIGASRMTDTQQPPDAWGVSEKQTSCAPEQQGDVPSHKEEQVQTDSPPKENANEMSEAPVRERADQRRAEEEVRFDEQKERAAERLRQLEEKMSKEQPVVQRTLYDPDGSNGMEDRAVPPPERSRPRTLFDPDRPYSSLVSGNAAEGSTEEGTKDERRSSPTMDEEYSRSNGVVRASQDEEQPSQPLIHISNYETRDRGERNNNAGPRMLFDPKSGSMVAAPSRDEGAGGRGKKGKAKGRKDRVRDSGEGDVDNGTTPGKSKRGKGRERRGKRVDDNDVSPKDDSKKRGGKVRPTENRFPRTCGVLYKRDERGNLVCADECEGGDQGYGAHSVPGGHVRNPIAYSKFVAQEKAYQQEGANGLAYGVAGFDDDQAYYTGQEATYGSPAEEPEMVQQEIDWVKPDEKIELVTGADDSPSLKATAYSFVPSQAALAAAAAVKEDIVSENTPVTPKIATDDAEESDEEEDHPSFVGLGFDPTENMDSVMQSPSVKASKKKRELDPVELAGLALDDTNSNDPARRNIFAFGSSATWGGGAASTDWASLTDPTSSQGVNNEGQDKAAGAASFLSLSAGNPWGSTGLSSSGFGGGAVPGSGSAGAGTTGD